MQAMNLTRFLAREESYSVWQTASRVLGALPCSHTLHLLLSRSSAVPLRLNLEWFLVVIV